MATISTKDDSKVFTIKKFLGLNESNDGDTQLKLGEASVLKNFEITNEYHLRVRPGYNTLHAFTGAVRGMWHGYVAGGEVTVCAADGAVWNMTEDGAENIGDILDAPTTFFGFGDKLYILNGSEYLVWDGIGYVETVGGYVPVIVTASAPGGGGTTLEPVNMLTGKRRVRFSADGTAKVYQLPEKNVTSIDFVFVEKAEVTTGFTVDKAAGTVTFTEAPAQGSNNVEVFYNVANTLRAKIEKMRFSEFFNGASDTRVFLYGDGSNKAYYCGVTETGEASAEYFPDLCRSARPTRPSPPCPGTTRSCWSSSRRRSMRRAIPPSRSRMAARRRGFIPCPSTGRSATKHPDRCSSSTTIRVRSARATCLNGGWRRRCTPTSATRKTSPPACSRP